MTPPRPSDDGPLAAIFMLCLLLVVAGGGIWYSIREKPHGRTSQSPGIETPWDPLHRPVNGLGFVEAFKRLPSDATAAQRAADEEFDNAAQLLTSDDLSHINSILAKRGSSRDAYNKSDFAALRQHGFGNWLRAQAISWSQADPIFQRVGESVWERSPSVREQGSLTDLAAKWGELDKMSRTKILAAVQALEGKSRDLSGEERQMVSNFAGEEYLKNR